MSCKLIERILKIWWIYSLLVYTVFLYGPVPSQFIKFGFRDRTLKDRFWKFRVESIYMVKIEIKNEYANQSDFRNFTPFPLRTLNGDKC